MGRHFIAILAFLLAVAGCESERGGRTAPARKSPTDLLLPLEDYPVPEEGVAAVILVDASGSMKDPVYDDQGRRLPKMAIAQRAVLDAMAQFERFSHDNPDRRVLVGIYEFSSRDRVPWCREVSALAPPSMETAREAVRSMRPEGGTPIGDAMIQTKIALDRAGLRRQHILVVTDGENNRGYSPGDVARAIARLPEQRRAQVHFIAFDVSPEKFSAVREAGGLVLEASNERDLRQTMDYVLSGRILVEEPVDTPAR